MQTTMRIRKKKCNSTWGAIFQLKCNTNTSLQMNRPISMVGIFVFFLYYFRCCHAWEPSLHYWFYNSFTFHPLFRIKWTHFAGLCSLRIVNFASSSLLLFVLDLVFSFSHFTFAICGLCVRVLALFRIFNIHIAHSKPTFLRPFERVLRLHNRRCHNVT